MFSSVWFILKTVRDSKAAHLGSAVWFLEPEVISTRILFFSDFASLTGTNWTFENLKRLFSVSPECWVTTRTDTSPLSEKWSSVTFTRAASVLWWNWNLTGLENHRLDLLKCHKLLLFLFPLMSRVFLLFGLNYWLRQCFVLWCFSPLMTNINNL